MKKYIIPIIIIILIFAIFSLREPLDDGEDISPDIVGYIYEIGESKFLVAEGLSGEVYENVDDLIGNAIFFTVTEGTVFEDDEESSIDFNDFRLGDKVKAYSTGIILESYPAQAEAKRVVLSDRRDLVTDEGCYVGGCSGEICSEDPEAMSTCELLPGTECLKMASCQRVEEGCGWVLNEESASCFLEAKDDFPNAEESRIGYLFEKADIFFE